VSCIGDAIETRASQVFVKRSDVAGIAVATSSVAIERRRAETAGERGANSSLWETWLNWFMV
jgi:hypothetical protein